MQGELCELNETLTFDFCKGIVTTLITPPVRNESDMHGLEF